MPRDLQISGVTPAAAPATSVRAAVLDFLSRVGDSVAPVDEVEFLAALSAAVRGGRAPAAELWDKYHGQRADRVARLYARYGY